MERNLEQIRADYTHHCAEVGHRARIMKRLTQEVQFHESRMESFAKEEEAFLTKTHSEPPAAIIPEILPKESA